MGLDQHPQQSYLAKMNKYKALISDVDGTLISGKNGIIPTDKVISFIKKAHQKIHIGLSTARPLLLVEDLIKQLALTGPSIVNGGAQIVDVVSGESLWEQKLLVKDLDTVFERLTRLNIPYVINDSGKDIIPSDSYIPKKPFSITTYAISLEDAEKVIKIVDDIPTISAHKFSWKAGKTMRVSINHINATKQYAILEIAKILNIDTQEIIGVGDSYNDLPLLMASGLKVAMGNAPDDLKSIADYIAPSVDEDGIVEVIEKFVI